jgi:hypothetical protein
VDAHQLLRRKVTDVEVLDGKKGVPLVGKWDKGSQQWTVQLPDPLTPGQPDELTVNASWTVIIHVEEGHAAWGHADDVDAHFECVSCFTPDASPPPRRHAPTLLMRSPPCEESPTHK